MNFCQVHIKNIYYIGQFPVEEHGVAVGVGQVPQVGVGVGQAVQLGVGVGQVPQAGVGVGQLVQLGEGVGEGLFKLLLSIRHKQPERAKVSNKTIITISIHRFLFIPSTPLIYSDNLYE